MIALRANNSAYPSGELGTIGFDEFNGGVIADTEPAELLFPTCPCILLIILLLLLMLIAPLGVANLNNFCYICAIILLNR